jgi:hypothetical protein
MSRTFQKMVFVKVIHPGVPLGRYLIEVKTARVFSLGDSSFLKKSHPRWLFSSLYWPLPKSVRCGWTGGRGRLKVVLPWCRASGASVRKNRRGFTVYGTGRPLTFRRAKEAEVFMERFRTKATEAAIAVSRPLSRVCMFLGLERSTTELLKAFTGPLIDASRCRTAPT